VLLPLVSGRLLVSRAHAVFCRIPPEHVDDVNRVLTGTCEPTFLAEPVKHDLDRHGFFAPPRPAAAKRRTVQLQLTNACNLACKYCCTNSGKARATEVSCDQMLGILHAIPELLGRDTGVAFLGGEPLLVPWTLDLADEALDLGLPLTLFTNGIPLQDEHLAQRAAALTDRGMKVRISLAGASAETCDALSGTERFEPALAGMDTLARFGGEAALDVMLVPQHVEQTARDLPELRKRIPPGTPIAFGVLYLSGRERGEHLFPSRAALEQALDFVAFEAGERIPVTPTSPVVNRREACSCALGYHVHVRSDGALFNCFKMEEKEGDLETDGFAAVAGFICGNPRRSADLPTCADCPLNTLCGGGCRSENLLYTGDPDRAPCGPWRVQVISELLAEDRVSALEWPLTFLLGEANRRGITTPDLAPRVTSVGAVEGDWFVASYPLRLRSPWGQARAR